MPAQRQLVIIGECRWQPCAVECHVTLGCTSITSTLALERGVHTTPYSSDPPPRKMYEVRPGPQKPLRCQHA